MPTKPGNGGHGSEEYNPENGQYVKSSGGGEEVSSSQSAISSVSSSMDAYTSFATKKIQKVFEDSNINDIKEAISNSISENQKTQLSFLSREEKEELLKNSGMEISPLVLKYASEEQLEQILLAQYYLSSISVIQNQILEEQDKKQAILDENKTAVENAVFAKYNDSELVFNGIWFEGPVSVLDKYEEKSEINPNTGKSSLDAKKEFYENILNSEAYSLEDKESAKNKLEQLANFEKIGKDISAIKENLAVENLDKLSEIDAKLTELYNKRNNFFENEDLKKRCEQLIQKSEKKNAPYSSFRKNKAIWVTSEWALSKYNIGNVVDASIKYFGDKMKEKRNNVLNDTDREQLIDYTGSGYSKYNKPLRGEYHDGWGGFNFSKAVTNLTNAIDKCTWEDDIWIQRGIPSGTELFDVLQENGVPIKKSIQSMSKDEREALVGTAFTDLGFCSAGAGKDTGYASESLILNIYCPKGTKMAYMNVHGVYAHSDENEMLLQRGYSYRITKVEKKSDFKYYVDCEVILDSDLRNNVYDKDGLDKIGKKYL